jgi:hypothetical protein
VSAAEAVPHSTPVPVDFKTCPEVPTPPPAVKVPVKVASSKVLFVNVSELEAVIYPAPLVNALLFVGISLVNAIVPVDVGNVKVPVFEIVEMTGDVKILFVNV